MAGFKDKDFRERIEAGRKAKQAMIEKFRGRPAAEGAEPDAKEPSSSRTGPDDPADPRGAGRK